MINMMMCMSLDEFRRTRRLGTDDTGASIFSYLHTDYCLHILDDGTFDLVLGDDKFVLSTLDGLEACLYNYIRRENPKALRVAG